MFQSFSETSNPEQGPPRLQQLREVMIREGLAGFMIPRADAHQGEYVAPCDERLAWLTGFTGSAGFCIVLPDIAGVFVDGRYRTQVKAQVDTAHFTPVDWPEVKPEDWLAQHLPDGGMLGFDPWLYAPKQVEALQALPGVTLKPVGNLIDQIWHDRPAPPKGSIRVFPDEIAGETHSAKRQRLASDLQSAGHEATVLTLPDSIAWLLNIRGQDIPRNPLAHGFAILHNTGRLTLFVDPDKVGPEVQAHLGADITLRPPNAFGPALRGLTGPVRLDPNSAPIWTVQQLDEGAVPHVWGQDPCILPKAIKNEAEITATKAAHMRDAAAMCEFLSWFEAQPTGSLTEIDVVARLEACRAATGDLLDISFETIAGSGPHGALPHYRVNETSNRTLQDGELLVLDSGGQYPDGTTDITRTLPIGAPGADECAAYTRVLQGMIAMSRVRWPAGLAGRDLDVIARYPLWLADQDYAHGTGHGVGVAMCVHEGPQRLSRVSDVPLEPGMIVSNEPGYYREGAFGIRIENLVVVRPAETLPGGDQPNKLHFETLNFVPIDRRLIDRQMLTQADVEWLNAYHADCREKLAGQLTTDAQEWLIQATLPL